MKNVNFEKCIYINVNNYEYTVCPEKNYTLLKWLPNNKYMILGGKVLYVWKAHKLNFHMTPKSLKIIHAWVSTGHFCKGYGNQVAQELAFQFVRGKSFGAYRIEGDMIHS